MKFKILTSEQFIYIFFTLYNICAIYKIKKYMNTVMIYVLIIYLNIFHCSDERFSFVHMSGGCK